MQYSPPARYQGAPRQSHVPRVLDPSVINEAFPVPVERPFRGKYKLVDTNAEKVMQKLLPSAVYWRGGSYGSVFRVPVSSDMQHYRDTLRFSVGESPLPPSGSTIIVKVAKREYGETNKAFVARSIREAKAHQYMLERAPQYVPALYFSGIDVKHMLAITGMEYVQGETLKAYLARHRMDANLLDQLRDAVGIMMRAGFIHADLHDENVLVQMQNGRPRIKIIDFGFGVYLSETHRTRMEPHLRRNNLHGAWKSVEPHVDAVQQKRIPGLTWYNPNAKALRAWESLMKPTSSPAGVLNVSAASSGASSGSSSSGGGSPRRPKRARRVPSRYM